MRTERLRVDFRSGQRLQARDLADGGTRIAELLALHQARLHGVWGIAAGYETVPAKDVVTVNPGLALDAQGRMLLLSRQRQVPLPRLEPGERSTLIASWQDRLERAVGAASWNVQTARLRWLRPGVPPRGGRDLAVVAATRPADGADIQLDGSVRRIAHGLVRPHIATGRVLRSSVAATGTFASWTLNVSTAAGGFTTAVPAYFVTLDDHPWGPNVGIPAGDGGPPTPDVRLATWVGPFVAVEQQARESFALRVSGHQPRWRARTIPVELNPVGFRWIGVDTSFEPFRWFSLFGDIDFSIFFWGHP